MTEMKTTKDGRRRVIPSLLILIVAAASMAPSVAAAQTARPLYTSTVTRSTAPALSLLPRPSTYRTPAPAAEARITVALRGSYSVLVAGSVVVRRNGVVVASGTLADRLSAPAGSVVDVAVTATGLVDSPTVEVRGVALPAQGGAVTIPVTIETGLVRAEATLGGRQISGVVRFYRIDEVTGVAAATSCGSIGAWASSQEISAGRYLAVISSGGTTLSRIVDIAGGTTRLVRLDG